MTIGDEDREVAQGDLVYIPPNVVHSLRPATAHAPIRCFCFAIGEPGIGAVDYSSH
jgi:mannose-6-phosphate isomerase-like protein (cupin superfamily)